MTVDTDSPSCTHVCARSQFYFGSYFSQPLLTPFRTLYSFFAFWVSTGGLNHFLTGTDSKAEQLRIVLHKIFSVKSEFAVHLAGWVVLFVVSALSFCVFKHRFFDHKLSFSSGCSSQPTVPHCASYLSSVLSFGDQLKSTLKMENIVWLMQTSCISQSTGLIWCIITLLPPVHWEDNSP